MELSPQQQAVVSHRGSDLQVIACAGSGKTESISRRIGALINEGLSPESIVAFTFTERAASELKERIVRRVEEIQGAAFLDRLGPMFVGTIHAYCFRLLQTHVPRYGNYDVLDEHRHAGWLSREYRGLGLGKLGARHWQPIRDFTRTVDVIGNELIDVSELQGSPLGDCYEAYREALDRYRVLTFSQIIQRAVEALQEADTFARVHGPLRHLFVDEYQDINPAQERLIGLLTQPPVELTVVGDDDQSIYQWRGADVRNILEFTDRREGARALMLDANRRSRPEIVETANRFARSIAPRLPKAMAPHREAASAEIVAWCAETPEEEAERIADTIVGLHADGFAYRDIAVLFRSVRTSAPPLIDALEARGIPLTCAGRTGLFLQPEIALLGELHAWFADGVWKDGRYEKPREAKLERVVAGLERLFGGGAPIPDLRSFLEDWKATRLDGVGSVNLVGDYYKLLHFLRVHEIDPDTPTGSARLGALARFSQVLADFEHVTRRGRPVVAEDGTLHFRGGLDRGKSYARALANYMVHYARDAYEDFEGEEQADLDAVDVLTVHQAKGLEWPVVFVPSLVAGRFPSRRAGEPQNWMLPESLFPAETRARYEGSEIEERRLFYVAMTRARDALYLSCFERMQRAFRPSPFLEEVAVAPRVEGDLPRPAPPAAGSAREPASVSLAFSDLAIFEECGLRYRLGTVLGFQQELAVELGYGKALHHLLRRLAETVQATGSVPGDAEVAQLMAQEFYLPFANAPTFDAMLASARRLIGRYLEVWAEDLHRVWAVERPFELHLPSGTLTGRADVILDREGGRDLALALVDYKTADDPRRDERFALQLAIYAAAGRGEGLEVEAAYLHELKRGERKSVDISAEVTATATARAAGLLAALRSARYEARPETTKCARCDYRRVCHTSAAAVEFD